MVVHLAKFIIPNGSKYYQNVKGEVVSDKIRFVEYTGFKITNIDPSAVRYSDCGIVLYFDKDGSTAYNGTANRLEQGGIITPTEIETLTGEQFPSIHSGMVLILGMGDSENQQDDFNLAFELALIS